ncbi:hypothetical protein [Rossellomorea aquimaris]|nr:hypothetical protein [Rossellomorea aquimaris]
MLSILYLPVLCTIIVGGSYLALKPIDFYTPKDKNDSFEYLFRNEKA